MKYWCGYGNEVLQSLDKGVLFKCESPCSSYAIHVSKADDSHCVINVYDIGLCQTNENFIDGEQIMFSGDNIAYSFKFWSKYLLIEVHQAPQQMHYNDIINDINIEAELKKRVISIGISKLNDLGISIK